MPLVIRCLHCKKALKVADDAPGKYVQCPGCNHVFAVAAPLQPAGAGVGASKQGGGAGQLTGDSVGSSLAREGTVNASPRVRPNNGGVPTPAAFAKGELQGTPSPPVAKGGVGKGAVCPTCKAVLLPGAISCMDCGFLLQPELVPEPVGKPNLCTNPACGVANSPKDRICQRCGSPLPTAPGTILHGRFRIERQLAVGGFGAVYLATDIKNGNRPVAVKDMLCADPQEFTIRLNFFRREAEILRSLEAVPIVPKLIDFIHQGQTAHIVLEFIRGQDLLKIMEQNGNKPFPIPLVIAWGMGICDVLAHMHGQTPPLIHRDLKPDNIMLLEDQSSIRMIDFGTARDLGRTQKTRMAAKTRVYTEGYAPPEQILGKPESRSDLFALAGTLYHLATGQAPEGFYTAKELKAQLDDPSSSLPAHFRWFFDLIRINLAEDPNDRYFSASEIKADLEQGRVAKEKVCPRCQTSNKVREPYCLKCASSLTGPTPPCTHCGKTNRMGSRCCIHCGNRLR